MPTTCGFPNCKFRSRYRGAEDNRHFYRVPKKPQILRSKWLEAIGRTEETIVSQLRVCSGHFNGGEKHEGDVPVADPAIDSPIKVELPPKIPRSHAGRRQKRYKFFNTGVLHHHGPTGGHFPHHHLGMQSPLSSGSLPPGTVGTGNNNNNNNAGSTNGSSSTSSKPEMCLGAPPEAKRMALSSNSLLTTSAGAMKMGCGMSPLPAHHPLLLPPPGCASSLAATAVGGLKRGVSVLSLADSLLQQCRPSLNGGSPVSPAHHQQAQHPQHQMGHSSMDTTGPNTGAPNNLPPFFNPGNGNNNNNNLLMDYYLSLLTPNLCKNPFLAALLGNKDLAGQMWSTKEKLNARPLVALLDERECSVELKVLKDIAVVAFCDAHHWTDLHHKVLEEAVVVLLWNSISLHKVNLEKFQKLKLIVKLGHNVDNVDVAGATELGIAVSHVDVMCVEDTADHVFSMLLGLHQNLYPRGVAMAQRKSSPSVSVSTAVAVTPVVAPAGGGEDVEEDRSIPESPNAASSVASNPITHPQQQGGVRAARLRGKTLGLYTLGQVGIALLQRAKAFGLQVLVFDPQLGMGMDQALGIEAVDSLRTLLERSDFVSVHCVKPTVPSTSTGGGDPGIMSVFTEETLRWMKPGAHLISIASHKLIDETALGEALQSGHLAGAALDSVSSQFFSNKTLSALCETQNLIVTPGICGYTEMYCLETRQKAALDVKNFLLTGHYQWLPSVVNKIELYRKMTNGLKAAVPLLQASNPSAVSTLASMLQPHNPHHFETQSATGYDGGFSISSLIQKVSMVQQCGPQ